MPKYVTPREAVSCIRSGDTVGICAFLTLVNPVQLLTALAERVKAQGSPRDLTIFCTAGFGNWEENSPCEAIVRADAVKRMVLSHFSSMPETCRRIMDGRMEGYNLPFGVMSHMLRAAASGAPYYITKVGRNLFVDPRVGGSKLNAVSTLDWVSDVEIDGRRYLKYVTPRLDAVLIKATSVDNYGNITFEKEPMEPDALSMAQAAKANGGKVIVQVERRTTEKHRPWNVIIPGALVDYVCICPYQGQIVGQEGYNPAFSGDVFVEPEKIADWVHERYSGGGSIAKKLIARRAARELRPGQLVNIGIGIPEGVAEAAAASGLLPKLTLTVESGAFGGMPAPGSAFGSSVGAQCICSTAQMFDLYDSGGLDICFIGALEIDREGNVNGHYSPTKLAGIGGFANITQNTKKVVFCGSFTSGGLKVRPTGENSIQIVEEGRFMKFVPQVSAVSFSARNAHESGQEVLYVTERCVFRLGTEGLELVEVSQGVDLERDVLEKLPFPVKVCLEK